MPFAAYSPVRIARLEMLIEGRPCSQRKLADLTGLSPTTISTIERLRNELYAEELRRNGQTPSLTTIEVAVRLCMTLCDEKEFKIELGRRYTAKQLVNMIAKTSLFAKEGLTDRPARCAKPYPGYEIEFALAA